MRVTRLKKIGEVGRRNLEANKILAKIWNEYGINECEIKLEGCLKTWGLGNAHRHKRIFYLQQPEKLCELKQVVRACTSCHNSIENDPDLTEEVFMRLRGEE